MFNFNLHSLLDSLSYFYNPFLASLFGGFIVFIFFAIVMAFWFPSYTELDKLNSDVNSLKKEYAILNDTFPCFKNYRCAYVHSNKNGKDKGGQYYALKPSY